MSWVRLDDEAPYHPKILIAGLAAFGLFCAGLCYANKFLTEGFIATKALPGVFPSERASRLLVLAVKLVEAGLWERREDGWQIHDYHHYQPTKAEVLAERAVAHAAKVAGGLARASMATRIAGRFASRGTSSPPAAHQQEHQLTVQQNTSPTPVPVPIPEKKQEHRGASNGSSSPPEFQIPGTVGTALDKCPTLGRHLRSAQFWQAQLRSKPGVNFAAQLLEAESWVVANPTRAPKKSVPAFMNRWLRRAFEDLKA